MPPNPLKNAEMTFENPTPFTAIVVTSATVTTVPSTVRNLSPFIIFSVLLFYAASGLNEWEAVDQKASGDNEVTNFRC